MPTEPMYFIHRLTASKPNWEMAMIYAKGVEPCPVAEGVATIRLTGETLILTVIGKVPYPDPNHQIKALCNVEIHYHIDEVVRVDFYSDLTAMPVKEVQPGKSDLIMPNETQIDAAKTGKLERV